MRRRMLERRAAMHRMVPSRGVAPSPVTSFFVCGLEIAPKTRKAGCREGVRRTCHRKTVVRGVAIA
jgi:hypothetical protein